MRYHLLILIISIFDLSDNMMKIVILRIGHRPQRDQRVTTHVGLTARALGASTMLLASNDKGVVQSINEVSRQWGGNFIARTVSSWKQEIHDWKDEGGKVVHLTMYGLNLPDVIDEISDIKPLMIVVGAEKVPPEIYQMADWNVAVGSQPHSEIAALAVFLDRLHTSRNNDPLALEFPGGNLKIIASERGKNME